MRTPLVYCPSPSFSEITNPEHVKSGFDSPYLYSPVKKSFHLSCLHMLHQVKDVLV